LSFYNTVYIIDIHENNESQHSAVKYIIHVSQGSVAIYISYGGMSIHSAAEPVTERIFKTDYLTKLLPKFGGLFFSETRCSNRQ